jgi:hypothetical protein
MITKILRRRRQVADRMINSAARGHQIPSVYKTMTLCRHLLNYPFVLYLSDQLLQFRCFSHRNTYDKDLLENFLWYKTVLIYHLYIQQLNGTVKVTQLVLCHIVAYRPVTR